VSLLLLYSEKLSQVTNFSATRHQIVYTCILTGTPDGLSDLTIPMSSLQARRRDGEPTYLEIVTPGIALQDDIENRPNGELVVTMAYLLDGATVDSAEICRVALEDARIDRGGRSASMTLKGHKTTTRTKQVVELANIVSYRKVDGRYTWRCATPDLNLGPGDTVIYDSEYYFADMVTYYVGPNQQYMEVKQQ